MKDNKPQGGPGTPENDRLEALLKMTAQRMGSTPEALKEAGQCQPGRQRRHAEGALRSAGRQKAFVKPPGPGSFKADWRGKLAIPKYH